MNKLNPLIFDIVKGSFVDGPGVRTTVFFKGCPLHCPWCHNPESQNFDAEIMHFPENCINCGNCMKNKECYTGAKRTVGKFYSPSELADILIEDKSYYENSGGGVTFSGGEALYFPEYLSKVFYPLKKENIHIAVQTCGYFDFKKFKELLTKNIDLIYFDFKIMNRSKHRQILGKDNRIILNNFENLINTGIKVIPRIPLIPELVANRSNISEIASFLKKSKVKACEFLFYNPASKEKLIRLKKNVPSNIPVKIFSDVENGEWIDLFKSEFMNCS